jgi:hypothetical protein
MNDEDGRRSGFLIPVLIYGTVWGLAEASLGHLLHLARVPGLPGLVMFPFAVLIMGRVLARSDSAAAVFSAGVVAAGFKFLDLLLPGTDITAVINPARAILFEALAGAAWASLLKTATFPFWSGPEAALGPKNGNVSVFWR